MTAIEPSHVIARARNSAPPVTSDIARTNNFDLVRLFGALQVAFVHASEHLHATPLAFAANVLGYFPGVPIFFAVSGFLVSLSLERATSLAQYSLNRALRIFPALWVCFALSVVIVLVSGVGIPTFADFTVWAAAQLTIVQFYNPSWLRGFGVGAVNGSLWTIPVELQFYGALPILALWAQRIRTRWGILLLGSGIMMLVVRHFGPPAGSLAAKLLEVSLVPYLFYFLVGVVLRYVYVRFPRVFRAQAATWALAYAAWGGLEIVFRIPGATGNLLNVVSILLLSGLAIAVAFSDKSLASRTIGNTDISYGVYIYHMPVVNFLLAHAIAGTIGVVLALAVTVAIASASWHLVEKPALRFKHYTLKKRD